MALRCSDQVYRMDYSKLVQFHRDSLADITIVCREVDESKAQQFGMVKVCILLNYLCLSPGHRVSCVMSFQVSMDSQITSFQEKPKTKQEATMMSMDWDELGSFLEGGATELSPAQPASGKGDSRAYIASCGMVREEGSRYNQDGVWYYGDGGLTKYLPVSISIPCSVRLPKGSHEKPAGGQAGP